MSEHPISATNVNAFLQIRSRKAPWASLNLGSKRERPPADAAPPGKALSDTSHSLDHLVGSEYGQSKRGDYRD
jgi:hypothetical protein